MLGSKTYIAIKSISQLISSLLVTFATFEGASASKRFYKFIKGCELLFSWVPPLFVIIVAIYSGCQRCCGEEQYFEIFWKAFNPCSRESWCYDVRKLTFDDGTETETLLKLQINIEQQNSN